MASEDSANIGGTVIQRCFIPRGLGTVLNVATVPVSELRPMRSTISQETESDTLLRDLTAQVLGIPQESIIDEHQYALLGRILRGGDFPRRLSRRLSPIIWRELYEDYLDWLEDSSDSRREPIGDGPLGQLSRDSLCLHMSPSQDWAGGAWPMFGMPFGRVLTDSPEMRELGLSAEALRAGMSCFYSGLAA